MGNQYVNLKDSGLRDPVDRYETPDSLTRALLRRVELPWMVREPACGTGRMARILSEAGHEVHATDLVEDGIDFLATTDRLEAVVTNPPYKDGLARAFVEHALSLCDGPVAMLLRLGFLSSQGRHGLFTSHPLSALMVVSPRIIFFNADGSRISGQVHDHAWFVWNSPSCRQLDFIGPDELPDIRK